MEVDRHDPGVPSWVDLGTPDPAGAAAFYGSLFGWEVPEGPAEAAGYRMATLRGRAAAGIGPAQNPGPPYWTTYVTVDDADATAAIVAANGGATLVPPMDVMGFGRMAVFTDPAGSAFSVWQPGSHIGAEIVNEPGAFCWNELITSDVDGAKAFYGAVFGWGSHTSTGGPMEYTEFKVGDRSIAGMMGRPPAVPAAVPDYWGVYFAVADTAAAMAQVADLGGSVTMGPVPSPAGTFAVVSDPQGATFSVIQIRTGPPA